MARPTHAKVQPAGAHKPHATAFLKLLAGVGRREGWREWETLRKFMEAAYLAQRGAVLKLLGLEEDLAKNEAAYMAIVRSCRHAAETMGDVARMHGEMVAAFDAARVDFLSPLWGEVMGDGGMGQFFTPWEVSRLMAGMIVGDDLPRARPITLHEPACGVGGMVLAASGVLRERGVDVAAEAHWVAVDVNADAVHGCYIQVNTCAISATVVHGNSLTLEEWGSTPTLMAVVFPKQRREVEEVQACAALPALTPPADAPSPRSATAQATSRRGPSGIPPQMEFPF